MLNLKVDDEVYDALVEHLSILEDIENLIQSKPFLCCFGTLIVAMLPEVGLVD